MNALIDAVFSRSRVTMLALVSLVIFGMAAYVSLPREADPDVPLPFVQIILPLPGVSPEDGERLLVKPTEEELANIAGVIQMDSLAYQGAAVVSLEFETTTDIKQAVVDVRNAVADAKGKFPQAALEPIISELNAQTLQPVVSVILHGNVPERALFQAANRLQDKLLRVKGILDADLAGSRDEVLEIIIRPDVMDAYGLNPIEIAGAIRASNTLVTAGSVRFDDGNYAVKIPGLVKSIEEAKKIPIRSDAGAVLTLGDVADIRRTFEDHKGYALFNNQPAIGINITKRGGANIVQVTEAVKQVTEEFSTEWPSTLEYTFIGDQSIQVNDILTSLTASIMLAILLVMIVVVAALGMRSALMVGFAIPCSFLIGMMMLSASGYTLNMMTMFAMVLSVGILVDGAIVVVEYADRKMSEGHSRRTAYKNASKRMFWPIVSSTMTTLAAFVPFLFWKDMMGEFMKYLPLTLIFVLSASMFVALIFLPVTGSYVRIPSSFKKRFGMKGKTDGEATVNLDEIDPKTLPGFTGGYARFINWQLRRPVLMVAMTLATLGFCVVMFIVAKPDVELFPEVDQEPVSVLIQARGNLSEQEKRVIAIEVSGLISDHTGIENIYAQTGPGLSRLFDMPAEIVALLTLDLVPFAQRETSVVIGEDVKKLLADVPGVYIEVRQLEAGPPVGKDAQIEFASDDFNQSVQAVRIARAFMEQSKTEVNGVEVLTYQDIEDTLPLPGIEWLMQVDREEAGRYGLSVTDIGNTLSLVTDGLLFDKWRPDDSDEEIDMRIRFPADQRTISALEDLRIQTRQGALPISNFVTRVPVQQVDKVIRRNARRVMDLKGNGNSSILGHEVSQGVAITTMNDWLASDALEQAVGPGVTWKMVGANEDQEAAAAFFTAAMTAAMFMIGVILLLQFNSFYHAILTLSAVVLSVFGVLLGIALSGQAIAVLLTGTGIVALAGIVVNNNIVLIDTFQHLRKKGLSVEDAVVRCAAQRLRPVLLTTITTALGLMPMAFQISVNFPKGIIGIGSATSGWWVQLSSAVIYGLLFSTLLTLLLTPVMLAAPTVLGQRFGLVKPASTKKRRRDIEAFDPATKTDYKTAAE